MPTDRVASSPRSSLSKRNSGSERAFSSEYGYHSTSVPEDSNSAYYSSAGISSRLAHKDDMRAHDEDGYR